MNNRTPKNKRGKQTRKEYLQFIDEAPTVAKPTIADPKRRIPNPLYPGKRKVIHQIVPPPDPRFKL